MIEKPLAAAAEVPAAMSPAVRPPRLDSIDLLRGLVMVIMALDHAHHYFTIVRFNPVDLDETTVAHFFTRWVTHVCAPAFVFLAGTGAFLFRTRGKTKAELSWFLFSRGIWLVVLELTVMRMGWQFSFDYSYAVGQTIWAIGWSMVFLSGLVFLPISITTAFGVAMIVAHNAFDWIRPKMLGDFGWLWKILHSGGRVQIFDNYTLSAMYPLIPWIGVMAAGYGFGVILQREQRQRRKILWWLGGGLTAAFVFLRWLNVYGDPKPWTTHESAVLTIIDFLNCDKYPPSLLFLLMTLGPAIASVALFERLRGPVARFFIVFGRVPLFFYVSHIFLIHALAVLAAYATIGDPASLVGSVKPLELPEGYGFGLPVVYLVWIGVSLVLYPACRWYADVKRRSKNALLSYL
ncbi:MAG: heparan-alpha-glucosaminide N-acetyltransferase domain-containing protein [Bacteroidota bacterium]